MMQTSQRTCRLFLLCLLTSIYTCHGQAGEAVSIISKGVTILKGLDGLFSKSRHRMTDITPPGLHFDMLNDESGCQLLQGMKMTEFVEIVTDVVEIEEFKNPAKMKKKVLLGRKAPINKIQVSDFEFEVGIGGSVKHGFIATMKTSADTFDLVICTQAMKFKLAPRRILHEVKQKSLFGSSESQYITFEEMSLSQEQKEQIERYLNDRLFKRFVSDFRPMIASDNSGGRREEISYSCNADQSDDCF